MRIAGRPGLLPLGIALAVWLPLAGCAHALREPVPITEISRGAQAARSMAEAQELAEKASILFSQRGAPFDPAYPPPERAATEALSAVREAASSWLAAAALEDDSDPFAPALRTTAIYGAIRAEIWLAGHEPLPADRELAATAAVQAAQWCARLAPTEPACTYWLGAALGVQARERPSTGISALPKIEEAFLAAAAEAPTLEGGGPDRALALLYLRAPGWPSGPGDPDLGLEHARKAVRYHPGHPLNQLALAEALAATGSDIEAAETCERARYQIAEWARAGEPDAADWLRDADGTPGCAARTGA